MHLEGLNALLVAVPLIGALVAAVLRLDEHLFTSEERRNAPDRRRRFAVTEEDGNVVFTDPDGHTYPAKRS
jgi:hypothetical protein